MSSAIGTLKLKSMCVQYKTFHYSNMFFCSCFKRGFVKTCTEKTTVTSSAATTGVPKVSFQVGQRLNVITDKRKMQYVFQVNRSNAKLILFLCFRESQAILMSIQNILTYN